MARNTKRKLAIFAGTSKCLVYAEAKYCASEMPGEIKYYECSRSEYCCAFGCCVSPGLHFHHLWYYWILVIIMFLVCSGGGWWYRYWLQGRYRAAASAIPSTTSNPRPPNPLRAGACQAQRARITYNSARNTVLLHRMWKGPQRNGAAPAYNGSATTSSHYQHMNVLLNDANCPYYQLYGPPPSYETVIAQSRGKLSTPAASPEASSNARRTPGPQASPNIITNPSVAQCFSYACNPSMRLNNVPDSVPPYSSGHGSPRDLGTHEPVPYPPYTRYCSTGFGGRRTLCFPYEYQEQAGVFPRDTYPCQGSSTTYLPYPVDKLSDTSEAESQGYEASSNERYGILNIDQGPSGSGERSHWESGDPSVSMVHRRPEKAGSSRSARREQDKDAPVSSDSENQEMGRSPSGTSDGTSWSRNLASRRDFPRERIYGGSLRLPSTCRGGEREASFARGEVPKGTPRSCEGITSYGDEASGNILGKDTPRQRAASDSASPFESNPSINVILESFVSDEAVSTSREHRAARSASTNSNDESKPRLDRSKSLE